MLPKHFSPSSLALYIDCPRAYFYKQVCKIQLPMDSVHLVFGSAIHKAIETYAGDVAKAKLTYSIEFGKGKLEPKEYAKYDELLPIGEKILDRWFEKCDFLNKLYDIAPAKEREVWIESYLTNPLTGEKLPIPMKGRMDMLTEKQQIVDYKTSSKLYDVNDEDFKFQTKLYALAYFTNNNHLVDKIVYFVLPKNNKILDSATPIQVIDLQFTIEDLAETFEKTKHILEQIELGEFKPGHCMPYCEHRKLDKLLLPQLAV
jgi:RecB family exonuclease